MPVRIQVEGRVNGREGATFSIDRQRGLILVRPKHERREYCLPTAYVAEMIVSRVVKDEMGKEKAQGIAPRKLGGGR